jgi:hypothetical protein
MYIKIQPLMKKFNLVILCLAVIVQSSTAQFRKYSNEFLNIGAGARGMAMGGAQVASVADGTAGYWNPAGLSQVKDFPVLTLQHAEYFSKIGKYDFISFVKPLAENKRVLGVSLIRFGVDDIPNTLFLVEPDGTINYGNVTSFNSADYALLLSIGQKLFDDENTSLSIGGSAKIIHRKIGKFATAWGFGLDAGLQLRKKNWGFGIMARDVTTTFNSWSFKFTEPEKQVLYLTNNDIPVKSSELTAPRLSAGIYRNFKLGSKLGLKMETSFDFTFDGKRNTVISSNPVSIDPHAGFELNVNDVFYFRGGVTNFQKGLSDKDTLNQKKVWLFQPGAGVGIRLKDATIDYAFSNLANQSEPLFTHIVSLRLNLRKKEKSN